MALRICCTVTNKGQAGRGSNVPHFPSHVITYTKAIHPLPSPWHYICFKVLYEKEKPESSEHQCRGSEPSCRITSFSLSPSIIRAQSSGPDGDPHVTPDGSAQVHSSSSRYSNSGRSWGQEHLQGAARWGNTSLTAATPRGWPSSRRKEERLPREMVFPRSTQTANHSLPWYKVVELVRTEDLLDLFLYFCLVRM